ncbi:MAG TPA: YqaA family protein [Motiliproteus sp.]
MSGYELLSLFASGFIASTLLPGGSELVLLYLLDQGQFPVWLLVLVATLGNGLGGVLTWWMGWWVAKRWPLRSLSPRQLQAQQWLKRRGYPALLLSWLPLIGDPLCFISGWLRMRWLAAALLIVVGKAARYALLAGGFQWV